METIKEILGEEGSKCASLVLEMSDFVAGKGIDLEKMAERMALSLGAESVKVASLDEYKDETFTKIAGLFGEDEARDLLTKTLTFSKIAALAGEEGLTTDFLERFKVAMQETIDEVEQEKGDIKIALAKAGYSKDEIEASLDKKFGDINSWIV